MILNKLKFLFRFNKLNIKHSKNNIIGDVKNSSFDVDTIIYNTDLSGEISTKKGSSINNSIIRGKINIGHFTSINGPGTLIYAKHNEITIGNYCSIAHNVSIMEFFHNVNTLSTSFMQKKFDGRSSKYDTWSKGSINIGSDVWIGTNCTILSGISIGNGCIVGSNSVVNKDLPDFAIAVGNPAKVIKYRFDSDIIEKLNEIRWWEYDLERLRIAKDLFKNDLDLDTLVELEKQLK